MLSACRWQSSLPWSAPASSSGANQARDRDASKPSNTVAGSPHPGREHLRTTRDATGRMSAPTIIHDPKDPRLAEYRTLNDAGLRQSIEGDDVCIAESALVVARLLGSPYPMRSALVSESRWDSLGRLASDLAAHPSPIYVAAQPVMNEIVGFDIHRGVLAAATRPSPRDPDAVLADARVVAVLEGINDHENMGVIFRNADALGVDAVLLDPTCCDPHYRRAIRVSMGAIFDVPFARLATLQPIDGWTMVALTPSGDEELPQIDGPDRIALLLGAEGPGLTAAALAGCHHRVRIGMRPGVDSIGVASASAIAFHHFGRRERPSR